MCETEKLGMSVGMQSFEVCYFFSSFEEMQCNSFQKQIFPKIQVTPPTRENKEKVKILTLTPRKHLLQPGISMAQNCLKLFLRSSAK